MTQSETIFTILNKMFKRTDGVDLSGDERSDLLELKQEIYMKAMKFENKINVLTKTKPEYVIKLLENDEFIGYVDYYVTEDADVPTVPALVKDINEVENDVYNSLEEALKQINILQSTANAFAELNPEDPVITYEPEQRR